MHCKYMAASSKVYSLYFDHIANGETQAKLASCIICSCMTSDGPVGSGLDPEGGGAGGAHGTPPSPLLD